MNGERLKQLRKEHKLTQTDLGNKINVTKVSISGYENGNRSPDTETLTRLADYFDVSTDYLLGRSDVRTMAGTAPQDDENLRQPQKDVVTFFVNLDREVFYDKPEELQKVLEQFELYYRMYKEQQGKFSLENAFNGGD